MPDALRLAIGTLTRLPVPAPRRVDRRVAAAAMLLAPLVGVVLGLAIGGLAQLIAPRLASASGALLVSALAVSATAYATRGLHLDGLADTADALGSGRPPAQALEIARRSDIGPFGVVTIVLVLLVQVVAYAGLVADGRGAFALAVGLGSGRLGLVVACTRGVPAARTDGLGAAVAGSVPRWATTSAALAWLAVAVAVAAVLGTGAVATGLAVVGGLAVAVLCTLLAVRRLGGITGDVLGFTVEMATLAALVILVAIPT